MVSLVVSFPLILTLLLKTSLFHGQKCQKCQKLINPEKWSKCGVNSGVNSGVKSGVFFDISDPKPYPILEGCDFP